MPPSVWTSPHRRAENGTDIVGNRTRVKVVKNKVAPPFKAAEFDMIYGEGISKEGSILDLAVEQKIIQKSGAWYTYGEMRIAQGRDNTRIFLKDNPELTQKLEKQLRVMFEEERKKAAVEQEAKRKANQSGNRLPRNPRSPLPKENRCS